MAKMSYMGSCKIGGTSLLCTSMSISKKVDPQFFDHVVGLRDGNYSGSSAKGPGTGGGFDRKQKAIYRYSRSLASANVSGPLSEGVFTVLMEYAISGETIDTSTFNFYAGGGKELKKAIFSSLTIDIKAGEVASFSAELVGEEVESNSGAVDQFDCKKLITWDKCKVECVITGDIVGFSLSVTNPTLPIYVSGDDDSLGPTTIRVGIQEVKGSVSTFDSNSWNNTPDKIKLTVEDEEYTINVVYSGPSEASASGPFVCTVPYTGASDEYVWE